MTSLIKHRGKTITVKERTVRAITFLPNGQQCETWLPKGLWKCDGECLMGANDHCKEAVILFRPFPLRHEGVWYAAPSVVS